MHPACKTLLRLLPPALALAGLCGACAYGVQQAESRMQGYGARRVVINEICAHNLSGLQDGNGAYGDWIELYNPGQEPVDLSGWTLSDDEGPGGWTFPRGTVLDEYLVVFADRANAQDAAGYCHTSFALNTGGETLYLYDAAGELVDALEYPEQDFDITYGRAFGSGEETGTFATATPGAANPMDFLEARREAALGTAEFSQPAGFYEGPVEVALTADDPEALIFYTTDGSDPRENGKLYTGPIEVESRAGEPNAYVSLASTFGFDIYRVSDWLKNYAYRYAPDPVDKATTITACLYKDGDWSQDVAAATYWVDVQPHTLPVVSVTARAGDLFGAHGIYMPGSTYFTLLRNGVAGRNGNFQSGETIDARVQLFGAQTWQTLPAEVSIGGQYTRAASRMKNLILDLQQGGSLSIPGASPEAQDLEGLSLKGPGNGTWQFFYLDAFWNNYLYDLGIGTQYNAQVVLYLQDEYWGVYSLRERKDADFIARHFGVDKDSLQRYSYGRTEKSEEIAQLEQTLYELPCSEESWAWLNEQFDLDEYTDYLIAQMYTNNLDGVRASGSNMYMWKATEGRLAEYADGRWRFLLNDLDQSALYAFMDSFSDILDSEAASDNIQKVLFQKLWEYPQFRTGFAQEFRRQMQTIYAPQTLTAAFDAWCEQLEPEMQRNFTRQKVERTVWAPLADWITQSDDKSKTMEVDMAAEQWQAQREEIRTFLQQRADYLLQYLDARLAQTETP